MTPGSRLKAGRKELGHTGKSLAALLGISPSLESEWESGKFDIRQPNAMAVNLAIGLSWEWIMFNKGPMMSEAPAWAVPPANAAKGAPSGTNHPSVGTSALPTDSLAQAAMGLAIAQCQAKGTAADRAALVQAFKEILDSLQS